MAYLKEEVKAGIIIGGSLIILTAFVVLVGGGKVFEDYDTYYVTLMNVAGLEVGSQVRLGGVKVGKVKAITPPRRSGEAVTLAIGIKKDTPLYRGTSAKISQVGFVGDIFLQLTTGKAGGAQIRQGEVIPSEEQVQMEKLMAKLDEMSGSIDSLIKNMSMLVNDIDKVFSKENIREVEAILKNTNRTVVTSAGAVEKTLASLKETSDKLGGLLNEVDGLVKDNKGELSLLITRAREDLEKAGDLIKTFEETAKTIDTSSRSVDKNLSGQMRNVETLLRTMNHTAEELGDVLQEFKHRPWRIIYKEATNE